MADLAVCPKCGQVPELVEYKTSPYYKIEDPIHQIAGGIRLNDTGCSRSWGCVVLEAGDVEPVWVRTRELMHQLWEEEKDK